MKKTLFIFVLAVFGFATRGYAQQDSANVPAKVYIIRATGISGGAVNFRAVIDDMTYCKIKNNRYSVVEVKPGKHTMYVTRWFSPKKKEGFEIEMEPGKTYYLRMVLKETGSKGVAYFEEITANSAKRLLEKYKEDTQCE